MKQLELYWKLWDLINEWHYARPGEEKRKVIKRIERFFYRNLTVRRK